MFKVNNKDTRTMPICSSVSIVNFAQPNPAGYWPILTVQGTQLLQSCKKKPKIIMLLMVYKHLLKRLLHPIWGNLEHLPNLQFPFQSKNIWQLILVLKIWL